MPTKSLTTDLPHSQGPHAKAPNLPSPADRPAADIVLYDGHCNFCQAQMQNLRWWDCCSHLSYLSIHDPQVAERWPDLPLDRLLEEMCLIERASSKHPGRQHWGAEAVRYLTLRLRRLWWLSPLMYFPGAMLIAKPAYRFIAKHRYRIAGKSGECESEACSIHGR